MKRLSYLLTHDRTKLAGSLLVLTSLLICFHLTLPAQASGPALAAKSVGRPASVTDEAKDVVNKLVAGDFEGVRAKFNQQMRDGLSAQKMKEVWDAAIQYHGSYKSQGEPSVRDVQGYDVVIIRCEMERSPMEVEVDFEKSGKVGGLWVRPARA